MIDDSLDGSTPFQRLVLLAVAELADQGDAPVHSYDVKKACDPYAEILDADLVGGITRPAVIRALSSLVEAGLLEESTVESPVGKGRPAYQLRVEPGSIFDSLAEDDIVGNLVESIRA